MSILLSVPSSTKALQTSSVHSSSRSIKIKQAAALFCQEKLFFFKACLKRCYPIFSHGRNLAQDARWTLPASLPVNYRQLSRPFSGRLAK